MKAVVLLLFSAVAAFAVVSLRGPRLAPDGTMFLLEPGMIRTEVGIIGFPAGSAVRVASQEGELWTVAADGIEFEVPRQKLTNNLDIAEALAASDAKVQHEAKRLAQQQRAAALAQHRQHAVIHEQRQRELAERRAITASRSSGALDRSSYDEKHGVASRPSIYWVSVAEP